MYWLLLTLIAIPARADYLTLYAMPSPGGIKWATPAKLARSALWNELRPDFNLVPHEIGHAAVAYQCDQLSPEVLTGTTGASMGETYDVLVRKKQGLGVLFHAFAGRMQNPQDLAADIRARMNRGTVSFIHFEISHETCLRLGRFAREFQSRGDAIPYGLSLKPRLRQGAGCSAYATAFVELAGLLTTEWREAWIRRVRVPNELIGSEQNQVNLRRIFSTHTWAEPQVPNRFLEFYDPDMMYATIVDAAKDTTNGFTKMKIGRTLGLAVDARKVPTPTDPIFKDLY